ncbi:hypothetical protein [Flagellimonas sp. S3867]|uniref:hypothetical protein n=1 Tax=Flagellimonas sp. S3867 TaxID=2768063 RepID=UPI001688B717|nr:hypothetical protein [Flagellimonas sp. S3867]
MEKQPNQTTPGGFIWNLSVIHLGLAISCIVFGILAYRAIPNTHFSFREVDNMFLIVVPVFALVCIFIGHFIYKQSVKNIPPTAALKHQLVQFQTASIINYALIESAILFGIVSFCINKNLIFLLLSSTILLYFFLIRPTKQKIVRDLNLKGPNKDLFYRLDQQLDP